MGALASSPVEMRQVFDLSVHIAGQNEAAGAASAAVLADE